MQRGMNDGGKKGENKRRKPFDSYDSVVRSHRSILQTGLAFPEEEQEKLLFHFVTILLVTFPSCCVSFNEKYRTRSFDRCYRNFTANDSFEISRFMRISYCIYLLYSANVTFVRVVFLLRVRPIIISDQYFCIRWLQTVFALLFQ